MKTLLILCAVITVAFASVMPMDFDSIRKDDKKDDFPITEEQIDCIKDGAYATWDEHRDLDEWFTDVEGQSYDLLDRLYDCYEKTGLKRKFCVGKLTVSAIAFYHKINKSLGKPNKGVMKELRGVVEDCLGFKIPIPIA